MAAGRGRDEVVGNKVVGNMVVLGMSLEALDAVVWDGLTTGHPTDPVEDVPRTLRQLAVAGERATEDDCYPLYSLVARDGGRTPTATAVALPFIVALAADPAMGARFALVELLVAIDGPGQPEEDWAGARALLADPDPAVRRAAVPLARTVARLLERWRVERHRAVRPALLLALGEAAAEPGLEAGAVDAARAVLADVLGGDDPVLWVAAVYASADLDRELPVRRLDRLVEVFSDLAVLPLFENVWFVSHTDGPCTRENLLWWIARRLEHAPEAALSFATRLIEASSRTGDAAMCREAMDLLWRYLTERRSVAPAVLPLAGALLGSTDHGIRFRAVNLLALLGPAAAPYADRLAELLDDDGADEYFDGSVGELARWALARIGDPRALPGLVDQLRAQADEQGRGYGTADPRRPEITDVLTPLRAHLDVLLPAIREAIRQDGARGGVTRGFLEVLAAWDEDALPALPDLLPLLADTWTSMYVVTILRGLGPAAASAGPALAACQVLDHPGNHWSVAWTAICLGGDREAALRFVGDAVLAAEEPLYGPFAALAEFGRDAEPYADRVRFIQESGSPWARIAAATTLWSITGRVEPALRVLEEFVLPVAAGGDAFSPFGDALRGLLGIGVLSPAIRAALLTVRESERRLSKESGYEAILRDEEMRALIERVLACDRPARGGTDGGADRATD